MFSGFFICIIENNYYIYILNQFYMQANELRIGNYCYSHPSHEGFGFYYRINAGGFDWMEKHIELYRGIPLTESLILQLGTVDQYDGKWKLEFAKHSTDTEDSLLSEYTVDKESDFAVNVNLIYFEDSRFLVDVGNDSGKIMSLPTNLQFIHQLQNFYHALTGKELIFRPQ